jgi:LysR family transcriptional regulator for metE and metH
MLETRHLKLIVAVSEEKSVTRAAGRLHLTQSALSHQLRDLEDRLATPLFHRVNKRMLLTQAGERLLRSAHEALGEMKRAEDDIAQIAAGDHGTLRISTECYTCYHWLPEMMKTFSRRFPQVDIKILLEATHHPLSALLDGKLDFAIVSDLVDDKRLVYTPLFRDEVVVIMTPGHRLASREFIAAKDFADETVFSYVPAEESTLYNKVLAPAGVKPARFSEVQLTEAMIEMVKAGLGISALARWAVSEPMRTGTLVGRPLTRKGFHRQWHAAMLKTTVTPPYVNEFIELLSRRSLPVVRPGKILSAA